MYRRPSVERAIELSKARGLTIAQIVEIQILFMTPRQRRRYRRAVRRFEKREGSNA